MKKIINEIISGRDLSKEDHRDLIEKIITSLLDKLKPKRTNDHIDLHVVCVLCGLRKSALHRKIEEEGFPAHVAKDGKAHLWSRREVIEWMKAKDAPQVEANQEEDDEIMDMANKYLEEDTKNYPQPDDKQSENLE